MSEYAPLTAVPIGANMEEVFRGYSGRVARPIDGVPQGCGWWGYTVGMYTGPYSVTQKAPRGQMKSRK